MFIDVTDKESQSGGDQVQ